MNNCTTIEQEQIVDKIKSLRINITTSDGSHIVNCENVHQISFNHDEIFITVDKYDYFLIGEE